jgi:2-polyprenyl-3-methyl-5-hydroxy-6-metoxy-1,4-benzoquinol methylase
MAEYSFVLDDAELARYDAMAARAFAHEAGLWDLAGITAGAAVVDLGCGPGAFLASLAVRNRTVGNRGRRRRGRARRRRGPGAG